ncbi:murein biosynthesis integral membrane protein MurJ, partial [Paenibacillus darwinianus]
MRRLHPVAAVAAVNAAGAFAAFMKDVLLAMFLGTSVQADAVALAVFVPEMIGILLLGTAIGTACVPIFAKIDVLDGRAALADRVWRTGGQVALLTIALYAACLLAAPSIVRWLAGGDGALEEATYPLLLIVLPIAVFYPIASVGMAVHQTLRSFLLPMAGPILTNVFMLASLSVLMAAGSSGQSGIAVVSWALTFGVAVLAAALWLPIRRMLRRAEPARDNPVDSADSSIAPRLQLWAMAGQYGLLLAGTHVVYLAERFLAARMETGAVAALNYAFRLSQLPVWVYVGAFAAVMLPQLSRQLALKQSKELRDTMLKGLHNVMLITLPVTVLLWMLREPVVELLFMRGS